jgi:L-fuculose-phosphate aldolase
MDLDSYKKRLITALRVLINENIFEQTMGHLSVRVPETGEILIPGHIHKLGRTLESLTEDDLAVIDVEGNWVGGKLKPPGERYIHTEIYRVRPDVNAVVHAHSQLSVAFSIAGEHILPCHHRGTIFKPFVPIHDYPAQINTRELGAEVAITLGPGYACLLRGHGVVCVGGTPEEAAVVAITLETAALHQMRVKSLGREPRVIEDQYLDGYFIKGIDREEFFANPWTYYSSRLT